MFGKKPPKPQTRIDSLIGAGTRVEGNVTFAGGLRIDGEVKGDVRCAEAQARTLVISEHARVEGQIAVAHLVVNGTIAGTVQATDFVELQPRSRVTGDVHYATMRDAPRRGRRRAPGAQEDPAWSADGRKIYFSAIRKPDPEYHFGDSEIYAVDLETLEVRALTDRKGPDQGARVSPDGKWIAYTGYDEMKYTSHLSSLYLMDADGGNKKLLAGGLPSSPSSVVWASDGLGLYYVMAERGESNVYHVATAGKVRKLTEGVHYLSGLSAARAGQAAAVVSTFHQPGVLVIFNLTRPVKFQELVDVNTDVLAGVKLGAAEELWAKSADGWDVQGWLIKLSAKQNQASFAQAGT